MRRGGAFLIDLTLFEVMWGVVDNAVSFPIAEGLMVLGSAGLFCLYFGLTEGTGARRASLGKRLTSLAVVSRDGSQASRTAIVERSAIIAAIFVVDWGYMFSLAPFTKLAAVISSLFTFVPPAVSLYNAWLAFRGPERLMLQDGLTYTRVIRSAAVSTRPLETVAGPLLEHRREWPRRNVCVWMILIALLAGVLFLPDSTLAREIEKAVADQVGIRNRVAVSHITRFSSRAGTSRALEISVWTPRIAWNEETTLKVVEAVTPQVRVEPGDYDSAVIIVWAGMENAKIWRTFPVELPELPDVQD